MVVVLTFSFGRMGPGPAARARAIKDKRRRIDGAKAMPVYFRDFFLRVGPTPV
jgi:hypothetical protein